jgi:hypothetical protein
MKSRFRLLILSFTAATLFVIGCQKSDPYVDQLTDEEIQLTAAIVGQSLTQVNSGLMTTLYDALSFVGTSGISFGVLTDDLEPLNAEPGFVQGEPSGGTHFSGPGEQPPVTMADENGTGPVIISNFNHRYNPRTGEHITRFVRSMRTPILSKTMQGNSVHIYTDADGAFIEFPRRQRDIIETIAFRGTRSGSTTSPMGMSRYTRSDSLVVSGFTAEAAYLEMDGLHTGGGAVKMTLPRLEQEVDRSYRNIFQLRDVRIDKEAVRRNNSLEEGVTGVIRYRVFVKQTVNGEEEERLVTGVIELTGDGSALLRFDQARRFLTIALRTGQVE